MEDPGIGLFFVSLCEGEGALETNVEENKLFDFEKLVVEDDGNGSLGSNFNISTGFSLWELQLDWNESGFLEKGLEYTGIG